MRVHINFTAREEILHSIYMNQIKISKKLIAQLVEHQIWEPKLMVGSHIGLFIHVCNTKKAHFTLEILNIYTYTFGF